MFPVKWSQNTFSTFKCGHTKFLLQNRCLVNVMWIREEQALLYCHRILKLYQSLLQTE